MIGIRKSDLQVCNLQEDRGQTKRRVAVEEKNKTISDHVKNNIKIESTKEKYVPVITEK